MPTVTKTIGTTGRDYSTIQAWADDLDNGAVYSSGDDIVGEIYDDSVFDEQVSFRESDVISGFSSVQLTVPESERHDGTAGTGARLVRSAYGSGNGIMDVRVNDFIIEYFEISYTGSAGSALRGFLTDDYSGTGIAGVVVRNCIVHDIASDNVCGILSGHNSNGNITEFHNNVVYNIAANHTCTGIQWGVASPRIHYFYNNTVFNCSVSRTSGGEQVAGIRYNASNSSSRCKNNVSAGTVGTVTSSFADDFVISGSCVRENNVSEDASATGTNSVTGATPASLFVSTVGGSEDLRLKAGAAAINAGTDLGSAYAVDAAGFDRTGRLWDIGAFEYVNVVTKTIGTSGRDYTTMQAWEDDLDNGAVYSVGDDAVGVCYDDSVFSDGAQINGGGSVGLDSRILTVVESDRHNGIAGSGVRVALSGNKANVFQINGLNSTLEWMEIDGGGNATTSDAGVVYLETATSICTRTIRNCLLHDFDKEAHESGAQVGMYSPGNSVDEVSNLHNNLIYNINHDRSGGGNGAYAIKVNRRYRNVLNNTIFNLTSVEPSAGVIFVQSIWNNTVTNNVVTDADVCFSGSGTVSNNASSDATATGSGSITGIAAADQFVSTVGGSEDLHLKSGSVCIDAGTDLGTSPTSVNIDINGRDRDAESDTWDIGAHEFAGPISLVVTISGISYENISEVSGVALANITNFGGTDIV